MKSNCSPLTYRPWFRTVGIAALVNAALVSLPQYAPGQTDNFDSGTLSPNWATSVCSNYPANLTFVTDAFGGKALRLAATTTAMYMYTNGPSDYFNMQNTARAMIWRTNQIYSTNFYIAVDLVGWNTSTDTTTNNAVIGILARATNVVRNPNVPQGRPDGVFFGTRYQSDGGASDGTRGQLNIYGIQDGQPIQNLITPAAAQGDYTINPGHTYRLVFTGTNNASTNEFYGRVYDLNDLTRPLATIHGGEPLYPSSPTPWNLSGYSGIFGLGTRDLGSTNAGSCDVTFDNFVAAAFPPTSVSFPGTTNGEAGVAQVVNRIPASYSNFYAPAGGITFTATTLGGGIVTSAKLFLNGVDVSAHLNNPAAGSSRNFTLPGSVLTTNTVYDARIELANAAGLYTTNAWTFDTFSDTFLASAACKNIECEDFDFNGQFIDNPGPSGYTFTTTYNNNTSGNTEPPLWSGAINLGSTSYVQQGGVNARTNSGVGDFFDYDNPYHASDNDFRALVGAGTSEGCLDFDYFDPVAYEAYAYTFDTQRLKYSNLNPDLQEYFLERTEGGEWENYTRTFYGTNYYNVYLRHGCELTQPVRLDLIGAGSTVNNLGTFYLTNALAKSNFRYAPLMSLVTPPNSLIANGTFAANALSFTVSPGYTGGSNPSSITSWTDSGGGGGYGINGTSAGTAFSPIVGGSIYAFLQGTGQALVQSLTTLTPNTTYQLVYSVAGRAGNTASYRVVLYSDNTYTTSYYDSGVQPANSSRFVTVTASFTTPATLGAAPNIQLGNASVAGDNTVDYANVFLVPGVAPVTMSTLAVVNLSGVNTLRLTMASAQGNATKQGLMLNYMAFVPAFVVLSSSQANTGYALDATASINQITQTITVPQNGSARFYRVLWTRAVRITSTSLVGSNIVMTYQ